MAGDLRTVFHLRIIKNDAFFRISAVKPPSPRNRHGEAREPPQGKYDEPNEK
jgi:hypothetical protein